VVVACHDNGWMDANGVIRWLEECVKPFLKLGFGRHARSSMVVLYSYRGHLTEGVKEKFRELNCVPAIIPSGCTAEVQPLDVYINRSFKASVRQQYQKWFQEEGQEQLTRAGMDPVGSRSSVLRSYLPSLILPLVSTNSVVTAPSTEPSAISPVTSRSSPPRSAEPFPPRRVAPVLPPVPPVAPACSPPCPVPSPCPVALSQEVHFTQVRTAAAYLTAIKARYSTPATVSLGRRFLPFLFPDLASFERSADLIAHLRSLDVSYRAASTEAQLALLPPPMAITVYFIATSLPDRLASVRDALLLKHPSELTIEVLESALKDIESNLRSVAAASGTVSPPLFHGCTVPQLPTFTASLATATTDATAAAVTTTSRSCGRGGKKGGSGGGGGGGSGGSGGAVATGGGGSAASGETPRAAAGDSTAPAGGGDPRARQSPPVLPAPLGGAAAWYQAQRQQHLQQQQQPLSSQQPQQQQRQQLAPGSGLRQPQRGAAYPPCPYQCFAQLTDTVRLTYGVGGPAPDWVPLVQRYGSALWGMSAEQLVDLISAPHAMYAVVDSSVSDSVYSGVVSLGASLAQLPVASVGTCVESRPATTSEDASLSVG
ncbi:unnamed protein product, partial [Closterium sp. NIES-54]